MADRKPPDVVVPLRKMRPCPICSRPSSRENFPFCSPQCADRDLHQWLSGGYAIPAAPDDEDKDDGYGRS